MTTLTLPSLPLTEWRETKTTLHLFSQIVGKIRLALSPRCNHWWHVPLYLSPRGLTTNVIPYETRSLELRLDFIDHALVFCDSSGAERRV